MARDCFILAFGAHPDDIEFGAGAIIAAETRAGRAAHFVICSRGEAGTHGTPALRWREAQKAAKILGATVEFLNLGKGAGDAHLQALPAHANKLAAVIRRLKPALVLAPTVVENQHPDHAALGKLVRDAARLARYGGLKELRKLPVHAIEALLFFAVTPDAEPRDGQPVLIDVSLPEILDQWTRAMRAHGSQMKTRDYAELALARARLCGLRAGVSHALPLFPADPLVFDSLATLGRGARCF